jgi:hypothetical protein
LAKSPTSLRVQIGALTKQDAIVLVSRLIGSVLVQKFSELCTLFFSGLLDRGKNQRCAYPVDIIVCAITPHFKSKKLVARVHCRGKIEVETKIAEGVGIHEILKSIIVQVNKRKTCHFSICSSRVFVFLTTVSQHFVCEAFTILISAKYNIKVREGKCDVIDISHRIVSTVIFMMFSFSGYYRFFVNTLQRRQGLNTLLKCQCFHRCPGQQLPVTIIEM